MEFIYRKQSPTKKLKLMLWCNASLVQRIEKIKPDEITTQEAMRQLLNYAVEMKEKEGQDDSDDILMGG